jgi:hypothetical protein
MQVIAQVFDYKGLKQPDISLVHGVLVTIDMLDSPSKGVIFTAIQVQNGLRG